MKRSVRPIAIVLTITSVLLAACGQQTVEAAPDVAAVTAVEIEGSELQRLTLSERAAERLGIETMAVTEDPESGRLVIPYSALLYDSSGVTWTYTSRESLVFIREQVEVARIEGDFVELAEGPEADTLVVTVGAAELWGAETGIGGGH